MLRRKLAREEIASAIEHYLAEGGGPPAARFVDPLDHIAGGPPRPRRVESFLNQYFAARDTVNRLKADLGRAISIDLLLKNNDGSHRLHEAGVDRIDNHIPEKYVRADVRRILGVPPH